MSLVRTAGADTLITGFAVNEGAGGAGDPLTVPDVGGGGGGGGAVEACADLAAPARSGGGGGGGGGAGTGAFAEGEVACFEMAVRVEGPPNPGGLGACLTTLMTPKPESLVIFVGAGTAAGFAAGGSGGGGGGGGGGGAGIVERATDGLRDDAACGDVSGGNAFAVSFSLKTIFGNDIGLWVGGARCKVSSCAVRSVIRRSRSASASRVFEVIVLMLRAAVSEFGGEGSGVSISSRYAWKRV